MSNVGGPSKALYSYKAEADTELSFRKGDDIMILDMCEGERRTLTIPYTLGYGEKGIPGKVASYSNLKYMIELVEFSGGKRVEL